MDQRPSRQLLSSSEQIKYNQAVKELQRLQMNLDWPHLQELKQVQEESQQHLNQLEQAQTKIDQLNDKLNWLRTLVRAGEINQLQDLVRKAKI